MGALSVVLLLQLYACFCVVFETGVDGGEVESRTSMYSGRLGVARFDCTMERWMEEITPEEVLRFRATCQKVYRLVTAEDMLVAKFAISRWYSANGSLS